MSVCVLQIVYSSIVVLILMTKKDHVSSGGPMAMNATSTSSLRVHNLRCEYLHNPLGLGIAQPRLSWQLISDQRGVMQSAYQILVKDEGVEVWNTGKVLSDQSIHVPYSGPALRSGQRCTWQVRVWDGNDCPSAWSEPAWWEMGLLHPSDWRASWIEPDWDEDPAAFNPCPYLRTTFILSEPVSSARVYVTAHGLYELSLNNQRVGDAWFTPGYTSYHHRLQYQTYDVGDLLHSGENVIGVILGDGWYRGSLGIASARNFYGQRLGLLLQLVVRYADGSEHIVISDEQWKASTGPILMSDLKEGESYDARLEMPGWDLQGFDDSLWRGVRIANYGLDNLVATAGPLVRRKERFVPVEILTTPAGETVVDMGQNCSGVVQLKVGGPAGTTIRLQHGEALDKNGNFTMQHLGLESMFPPPRQEVLYTLKEDGEEVYTPRFTVHGFRYVKVEGFPGIPTAENFTGIALYSDLPETGTFACSDPLLNQLQHNILWSQKSNFLEIPTDCPTRERAGWTGDAQIFVPTGSFLMQTAGFFSKWLKDLAAEQEPGGRVANMIPSPESGMHIGNKSIDFLIGAAGWGDAAVIVPWTLYQIFGDQRILQEQYASMKAWVEYERHQAQNKYAPQGNTAPRYLERRPLAYERYLWDTNYHWGEWLEPDDPVPGLLFADNWTPEDRQLLSAPHIATAYFAYSTHLLAETARILGNEKDAQEYSTLHQRIKEAYITEFVSSDGQMTPHKQATYVRALAFDLLPEQLRPAATHHLAELVRSAGTHLGTGFLSTPYLCPVLAANGSLDLAYALLKQETRPSWLYAVKKGATTIWESWDGIDEEGTPHNSLNHYSYGAIGNWLYQVVAGIAPGAPGYKHITFQPRPGGGLTAASATYQSLYGEIACRWQIANESDTTTFTLTITVPANTTATVVIPTSMGREITEGKQALEIAPGITSVRREQDATYIDVGSGSYTFIVTPVRAFS
jgi:alpha-L-rhamnosidase